MAEGRESVHSGHCLNPTPDAIWVQGLTLSSIPNTQYCGSMWWNHQGDDDDDEITPEDDAYVPRDSCMGQEKH
jgi:hypothetical protein